MNLKTIWLHVFIVFCLGRRRRKTEATQVVPVGQLFVSDVGYFGTDQAKCVGERSSEHVIRRLHGCYQAQPTFVRQCTTVTRHRELSACCDNTPRNLLAIIGAEGLGAIENARPEPCYRIQEMFVNYCVTVPSFSLQAGCSQTNPCPARTYPFLYNPQSVQGSNNGVGLGVGVDTGACVNVDQQRFLGGIVPGCQQILTNGAAQRKCIRVKRNQPSGPCCTDVDAAAPEVACSQFEELESEYCFDIQHESIEACGGSHAVC